MRPKIPLIDLHTHILPRTDDGLKTTKESLNCLSDAIKLGYQTIVLTPHYLAGVNHTHQTNLEEFRKLKKRISKKRLNIELILANEVMLDQDVLTYLEEKKIVTINKSQYLLVELPMYIDDNDIENIIYQIKEKQIIPIIAHPERNVFFQKDLQRIDKFFSLGVVFQCNAGSFLGFYGKEAQKIFQYMLDNQLMHVIASDTHRSHDYQKVEKTLKKLLKDYHHQTIKQLFFENPKRILNNQPVEKIKLEHQKKWFL